MCQAFCWKLSKRVNSGLQESGVQYGHRYKYSLDFYSVLNFDNKMTMIKITAIMTVPVNIYL